MVAGIFEAHTCEWPEGKLFTFFDEPGEHDPCYVVMPDGAMLPLNHSATPGVDIARAKFIIAACNSALSDIHKTLRDKLYAIARCSERMQRAVALDAPQSLYAGDLDLLDDRIREMLAVIEALPHREN